MNRGRLIMVGSGALLVAGLGSGTEARAQRLEMDDAYMEGIGHIASGTARLAGVLRGRNYPGLRLHSEVHQGLGHVDTAPAALARGLRLLYPRSPQ